MEFCILGPLLIRGGSGPSTVPGAKERMLLARLVVDVNRTVGTQALVDELWADHPPPSAVKSLQTFVARLRAILEPEHRAPHSVLRFDQTGYRLAVNRLTVDAERFGDLLAAGRSAVDRRLPAEGRRHLTAALALWRGPALPELAAGPFGRAEQYRLEGRAGRPSRAWPSPTWPWGIARPRWPPYNACLPTSRTGRAPSPC